MTQPSKSKSKRLQEILRVFIKYKVVQNFSHQRDPEMIKQAFEELGPTFIKIGQMLSVRTDLLDPAFAETFKTLQDNVKSDDFAEVKKLLEAEWDLPIEAIFDDFDQQAFASASIGQAHRGVLKNGQEVVVKVQHPGIVEAINVDLSLFEKALPLARYIPESNVVDLKSVLREVRRSLDNETDFLLESQNAAEFYQYNDRWRQVRVPRVYEEFCTKKVVVMEFMPGQSLRYLLEAEDQATAYNDVSNKALKKEIAALLVDNFMKEVFADGFFHADPHPGNLLIHHLTNQENQTDQRAPERVSRLGNVEVVINGIAGNKLPPYRLIFLDFGMMGHINDDLRSRLMDALIALYAQDIDAMTDAVLRLTKQEGEFDEIRFRDELSAFLQEFGNVAIKEIDIQEVLVKVIRICHDNNLQVNEAVTMLIKAFSTLEGVIEELDPDLSLMEAIQPFARKYFFKHLDLKEEVQQQGLTFFKNLRTIPKLPEKAFAALDTISSGKARLNVELREQDKLLTRIEAMVNRLVIGLVLAAVIVSSALLVVASPDRSPQFVDSLGIFGYLAAFVTILLLAFSYLYHRFRKP